MEGDQLSRLFNRCYIWDLWCTLQSQFAKRLSAEIDHVERTRSSRADDEHYVDRKLWAAYTVGRNAESIKKLSQNGQLVLAAIPQ
jgi:hypothetical protein